MGLPTPRNTDQQYLAAIADRLAEQNTLLGEIRDHLTAANRIEVAKLGPRARPAANDGPADTPSGGAVPVDLREPDPPPTATLRRDEPAPAQPAEPPAKAAQPPKAALTRGRRATTKGTSR